MTIAELITEKLKQFSYGTQVEILDFVEFLEAKKRREISELEREHINEALKRADEVKNGTAQTVSYDEFKAALHR